MATTRSSPDFKVKVLGVPVTTQAWRCHIDAVIWAATTTNTQTAVMLAGGRGHAISIPGFHQRREVMGVPSATKHGIATGMLSSGQL